MSEPKPGDLARRAKAREKKENAPVPMETMLGLPAVVTVGGRELNVYPVTLGRMRVFGAAQARLGDLGYLALVDGNPALLDAFNAALQQTRPDTVMDMEGVEAALRMALLTPSEDTVEAMLDIAEAVLNGDGQRVTREELEADFMPSDFLTVFRTAVRISGLNP